MRAPTSLRTSTDYPAALLWLIAELGSARTADVIAEFERRLGRLIPPEHREANQSGNIKWQHYVRWARQDLVGTGLMGSGGRGIWTITGAGQTWLSDHPDGNKTDLMALKASSRVDKPTVGTFRWRGKTWQVNKEKLLKQVRSLLAHNPPREAIRYRDWGVYIDGQPVSAKWLFHLITEAEYNEFDSPTARRLLADIGLEARRIGLQLQAEPSRQTRKPPKGRVALRDEFFQRVAERLPAQLEDAVSHGELKLFPRTNCMQVHYPEFTRSHYELRLARGFDEIAFHFEAGKNDNLARLAEIQPRVHKLSQALGHPFVAEAWGTQWARLAIEFESAPWTAEQAGAYASLLARFIETTFPLLRQAFAARPPRRGRKAATHEGDNAEAYAILDQQINQIRRFLQGRADRPTDEVLCDWVQFCYTFQLFREATQLFDLIDPSAVDTWPYERARRLVRVCRIRAR
jgi:hypothetical protein